MYISSKLKKKHRNMRFTGFDRLWNVPYYRFEKQPLNIKCIKVMDS